MNGWFLGIVCIYILSLSIALTNHGKEREDIYNFWETLSSFGIILTLIYMAIKTGF